MNTFSLRSLLAVPMAAALALALAACNCNLAGAEGEDDVVTALDGVTQLKIECEFILFDGMVGDKVFTTAIAIDYECPYR